MSLNRIIIMGRMTRDPELRHTQSGVAVTSFTLAVDRDFKGQNGEKEADFIDVVAWRNTAEFAAKYFGKGRMAVVEGRLQSRRWTDKDGNKRTAMEVLADNVYFGDSKSGNQSENTPANYGTTGYGYGTAGYGPTGGNFTEVQDDGELPF